MTTKSLNRKRGSAGGLLLAILGLFFLGTAERCRRDFHAWQRSKPVELAIDLSAPGLYSAPFRQTCPISEGAEMCLLLPPDSMTQETLSNRLSGVRFTCRIVDESGRLRARQEFRGRTLAWEKPINGAVPLLRLPHVEYGRHTLSLIVTRGSEEMRRVPLKIIGRHMLSGMEILPSVVALLIGLASLGGSVAVGRVHVLRQRE